MTQDRTTMLFFDVFSGLPRQGPGDAASTLRALALVPGMGAGTRVLDIGCGTGLQTRVLAQHSTANFVAIDNHPPFIEELDRRAQVCGVADRIDARVGDMRNLELPHGSFDVIWCEGAVYVIGFEAGLREWRRFLAPGGYIALTQVCWTKPDPPEECLAFWSQEYPAIRDTSVLLETIAHTGYETLGHFTLPRSAWWDDYYRPLEQNLQEFRERHSGEIDAQQLADQIQREIDIWHAYSDFYGYEFFVMRAR
jgi:ubiquinone/menaquinone biosynthesis C-methylase UbiE